MASSSTEVSEVKELTRMVKKLTTEFDNLKKQVEDNFLNRSQQKNSQFRLFQDRNRQWNRSVINSPISVSKQDTKDRSQTNSVPVCWRCGQEGHLKKGCRVVLHNNNLNMSCSMERGTHWAKNSQ